MRRLFPLIHLLLSVLVLAGIGQCQPAGNNYLVRMERQTREEDVCMLVQTDGSFHLERIAAGHPRIYEGTLPSPALSELEPLLTANQLIELKQSQIESTPPGTDIDEVMLTIPRQTGWQTLTFPNPKSRKPLKSEIDPILKWLDRNKQQQNPIEGAASTRCTPSSNVQTARGSAGVSNPYVMRIAIDHYEPTGSGSTLSSVSAAKGTGGQSVGGMTNSEAMDVSAFKITRTCAVVYESGRYRFEKSVLDAGKPISSDIYRDTLSKSQLDDVRQILANPKLAALPNNVIPTVMARQGDLINLTVPRGKNLQSVGFVSSGPRPASADLKEASWVALGVNVGLTNPLRKWVKQNLEDNKAGLVKNLPATTCIPSVSPE